MFKAVFGALAAFLLYVIPSQAQSLQPSKGEVEVIQDSRINQLTEKYQKMSQNNPGVEGYRVQIFFDSGSNSKNKAASIKADFELKYPGVKSYLSYKEPYYRVRVGNFRTQIEADGFQKKIAMDYPNSFAVREEVVF